MERRGTDRQAWFGSAGHVRSCRGKAGTARQGQARRGQVRQARWVMARSEEAGLAGKAGRDTAWQVEVRLDMAWQAWFVLARCGEFGLGLAGEVGFGVARLGVVRRVVAWCLFILRK